MPQRIAIHTFLIALLACSGFLLFASGAVAAPTTMPLAAVRTFMYQLQNLEDPRALDALAQSPYDMLVVEPTATTSDNAGFDMKAMVNRLHAGRPGRIVLGYLDAAQAETFRTYWEKTWIAPTRTAHGSPAFLISPDPDGWSGDFPVAYWDRNWQDIIAAGPDSQVKRLMRAGFDGLYLDWIDAWDFDPVVAEAKKQHVDPARAMVDFLSLIRTTARALNPDALVVQQNAYTLLDADPRLLNAIDALGVEDTWFSGKADAKWGSKGAGDVANKEKDADSTAARLKQYEKFLAAGKPVFTIDYCVNPANAAVVYSQATTHHLVPLVTEVSLDRMTATPPSLKTSSTPP
jgi:cysteinyl-tRNA synthetase